MLSRTFFLLALAALASSQNTPPGTLTLILGGVPDFNDGGIPIKGGFNVTTYPGCDFEQCTIPLASVPACVGDFSGYFFLACFESSFPVTEGGFGSAGQYPNEAIGILGSVSSCKQVPGRCGANATVSKAFQPLIVDGKLSCSDADAINALCKAMPLLGF